jgi:hypothetical protein
MRLATILGVFLILTGCMKKTDLAPPTTVTRVAILYHPSWGNAPWHLEREKVPAVATFIAEQRSDWTRAFAVGFGTPSPFCEAQLYDGGKYLGSFSLGASALPGSAAFFEVHYGDVYARKRITRAEANRFLDLVGLGGDLK